MMSSSKSIRCANRTAKPNAELTTPPHTTTRAMSTSMTAPWSMTGAAMCSALKNVMASPVRLLRRLRDEKSRSKATAVRFARSPRSRAKTRLYVYVRSVPTGRKPVASVPALAPRAIVIKRPIDKAAVSPFRIADILEAYD